jgi:hypothetical protein
MIAGSERGPERVASCRYTVGGTTTAQVSLSIGFWLRGVIRKGQERQ